MKQKYLLFFETMSKSTRPINVKSKVKSWLLLVKLQWDDPVAISVNTRHHETETYKLVVQFLRDSLAPLTQTTPSCLLFLQHDSKNGNSTSIGSGEVEISHESEELMSDIYDYISQLYDKIHATEL